MKRRSSSTLATLAAATLVASTTVLAGFGPDPKQATPTPSGSVLAPDANDPALVGGKATFVDPAGVVRPAPFAHVALFDANGQPVRKTQANKFGLFKFAPVKPGDYTVKAAQPKLGKGEATVTAEPGKNKVEVKLSK